MTTSQLSSTWSAGLSTTSSSKRSSSHAVPRSTPAPAVSSTITVTIDEPYVSIPTRWASISTTLSNLGASLLTSTCTDIYFAELEDTAGNRLRYVQFGCSNERPDCCPYGFGEGVALERCVDDYTTQVLGTHTPRVAPMCLGKIPVDHLCRR